MKMKQEIEIGDLVLYPYDNTLGFVEAVGRETLDGKDFLSPHVRWIDNNTIDIMFGNEIVGTELSASVELVIAETEPGIQGDRVSGATKPATLETGLNVQVPLFLETGEKIKVTPLAFIAKALVSALKEFPNFNASLNPESNKIIYKKYFHIGFAVDTPHGLMVPKLRNVDQMSIQKIGEELKNTSQLCRELKIDKKEFFGGSMTISSLGGIGGTHFTPIINPPEVAILGVGKTFDRLVKEKNQIVSKKILPISLSYDHRLIDGAEGARFCVYLGKCLGKDFAFKLAV